ncbi:MAG: hypothetical protein ACJAWP_001411 [Porticoccus sp.]|jgi:hypothetical protein|tara:strand:- start:91739 stop:92023 length:285 start_codon:yes stop_codon:yes gene_type:complete
MPDQSSGTTGVEKRGVLIGSSEPPICPKTVDTGLFMAKPQITAFALRGHHRLADNQSVPQGLQAHTGIQPLVPPQKENYYAAFDSPLSLLNHHW